MYRIGQKIRPYGIYKALITQGHFLYHIFFGADGVLFGTNLSLR